MTGSLDAPPRIAAFLPLAVDWQPVVPFDLVDDRRRLLGEAIAALEGRVLTVEASVIATTEEAGRAAGRAAAGASEVVLILATMAVLPSVSLAAIDRLQDRAIVVWALQQAERIDARTDHATIVADGGTVGAPMLTSHLVRAGRPFELVFGSVRNRDTIARVGSALRAAAAARRISTARIGRVGAPGAGYDCVDLDEDRLRSSLGVDVVHIDPAELFEIYCEVPDVAANGIVEEARSNYVVDAALSGDDLAHAARAAAALEQLVSVHDLSAGAIFCHCQGIRFEPGLGFAPCFALGRMTSLGVPWSCSGDLPAAMAMLTLKALGAAAQYHELELLDAETGEFLIASSGEHDLAFSGEPPRLVRNGWFPADRRPSVCACFGPPPGPATLVGFVQIDAPAGAHRFVFAEGEFGLRTFAHAGTPNAAFRFGSAAAPSAWERWCRAGVGLHSACTPGALGASVETMGRLLGVEVVAV